MARINFNEIASNLRKKKFDELFEQKPFLRLHPLERMWWIRYLKLQVASKILGIPKFPELNDGPIVDMPWFKLDHPINLELNVIQRHVEIKEFDWEHLQNYRVDMVFCDRHPSEGCEDCNSYSLCKIKMER